MQVSELISRLSKPYWMPEHISVYLNNWSENVAHYNLYWVFCGKPLPHEKLPIAENLDLWRRAMLICALDNGDMQWVVTTNTAESYYHNVVLKDKRLLGFYSQEAWKSSLLKQLRTTK